MAAVATLTGAPTHGAVNWNTINWRQAHRNVRRLQVRIVKAIKAGPPKSTASVGLFYHRVLPGGVSSGLSRVR
jgi:hypothetical protein